MNLSLNFFRTVGFTCAVILSFSLISSHLTPSEAILQPSQKLAQNLTQNSEAEERIIAAVYLNQQAADALQKGDPKTALEFYQQALAVFRQFKAQGGEINSLNGIGNVYLTLAETDQALEFFQQALTIAQSLDKTRNLPIVIEAYTLQYLTEAYLQKRQFDQALKTSEQALRIFQVLLNANEGERTSLQNSIKLTLSQQGALAFKLGNYPKSWEFYQKSLPLYRQGDDKIGEAQTLNNIGVVYANLNQYQNALNSYQQALTLIRTLCCYKGDEAAILNNISSLYFSLNQPIQALEYAQQASAIYQYLRGEQYRSLEPQKLELLKDILGQNAFDPSWIQQNLAKPASLANPEAVNMTGVVQMGEAINLNNWGLIYLRQREPQKAKDFFEKALKIYQENQQFWGEALTLNNLAQGYGQWGETEKAIATHQQALALYEKLNDKAGIGLTWGSLGKLYYQQHNLSKAQDYLTKALKIQQEINDKAGMGTSLIYLGALAIQSQQLPTAVQYLNQAIANLESLRPGLSDANKISLFETQALAYRFLQKALISQQTIEAALEISERGRARAFVELLASRLNSGKSSQPQIPTTGIDNFKQVAKTQNATLVEYSIISDFNQESDLYIWVIQPTGEVQFRKVGLQDALQSFGENSESQSLRSVTELTVNSRNFLLNRRGKQTDRIQRLQNLYQILIQPIAEFLPKDSQTPVIFIPQGALFLIPFPALVDSSGAYLISRYPVAIAPSIQVLALTQDHRSPSRNLSLTNNPNSALIVGNPEMPSVPSQLGESPIKLSPLPGSEVEAKTIGELLKTNPLIGVNATETSVQRQLQDAQMIHLATHGLLDEYKHTGWGVPGAIALTPDQQNDGFLTASEIMDFNLNASLVVLSACNTGKGRLTSDGMIGLSRAFLSSGVSSIIVSLWAVPDLPTAELMTEFYRQLQQNPNRVIALQQAMLKTMKQYPQPFEWSGFILMGETR